ncbi:MAG: diacylglycerol kinase family lipid kinase [Acidobacteriia bacterium]|nr:diacylglycerol kinase family lipid kinase [Terriglobia bacterium]
MDTRRFRQPCVILNPKAGSGRSLRTWPRLQPLLEGRLGPVEALFTEAPGHATELARGALESGADLVVAIGGDGTLNEVVNGFLTDGRAVSEQAAVALLPLGTGGDFKRSAALPEISDEVIKEIAERELRRVDVCLARFHSYDGKPLERYFVNGAGFGLGGEVAISAKNNFLTRYSGTGAFLWATAVSFLTYRARTVRLAFDEGTALETSIMEVALGNGQSQGGGMQVCPRARLDSGSVDVSVIRKAGFFEFLAALPYLYSGRIYSHPKCDFFRARRVVAESDEEVSIQVDGEAVGTLPLEVETVPGAIPFAGIGTS